MPTKKKQKRQKRSSTPPKPSELLRLALERFGPNGEKWIQGEEETFLAAAYIDPDTKERIDVDDFAEQVSLLLTDGNVSKAGEMLQTHRYCGPDTAFCAIGALKNVDTARKWEAEKYLAMASGQIDPVDPVDLKDDMAREEVITSYNDADYRTWPQVKAWFNKAIKLAQRHGD